MMIIENGSLSNLIRPIYTENLSISGRNIGQTIIICRFLSMWSLEKFWLKEQVKNNLAICKALYMDHDQSLKGTCFKLVDMERKFVVRKTNIADDLRDRRNEMT